MSLHRTTSPFSRSLRLAVALACALMVVFAVYVVSEKRIDRAHELRYQSQRLADELRQSSDDLTRMARTFVLTGNPIYQQHYLDILAIRDGKKPRPVRYDSTYWDLVTVADEPTGSGNGAPVALQTLLRQAGFAEDELLKLAQAQARSDQLTHLEFAAMALLESAGANLPERRSRAGQMLHDRAYQQAKADIMRPLAELHELVARRTLQTVQETEARASWLRLVFVLLALALLLALWRSFKALRSTLGAPVDEIHAHISRLGQGNFGAAIEVTPGLEASVLGRLLQTQQQLKEMAQAQQASEAKLQRLNRLYAAVSDCNQAIVRCTDEAALFAQICRIVVEHGGMKTAWIGLLEIPGQVVRLTVSHGVGVEQLIDIHITADADEPTGRGPTGITVRRNQPFWCQDYQHDPITAPWHALGARLGWAASAALPLHRNGRVIGALNVYAGEVNAFDAQTQKLLVEMAADIDYALGNFDRDAARLRSQQMDALRSFMLERLTSDLPLTDILNDFVLKIEDALPGALGSVLLLDNEAQRLTLAAAPHLPDFFNDALDGAQIGPHVGSCATAVFAGQRAIVADMANHPDWAACQALAQRAGLAACWSEPIRAANQQVLGIFAIYHRSSVTPQAHELERIEMAAALAAIAIERKHAEVQLQLKARVFEQGNEAIVITDDQSRIVRVNRAFCLITGYNEAEVLGRNPKLLSSGRQSPDFYQAMWTSLQAHGQWQGELWNRRKDGSLYPEWLSISVLRDRSGAVMNYVAIATDISQRKEDELKIRMLADFDPLTGLPNRRLLQDRIDTALSQAQRHGEALALIFLDLDRFKNVNDSLGHHAGDELLTQVAQRLKSVLREQDTVCRVGGDEFVLLCTSTDAAGAAHVANKLLEIAAQRYLVEQQELVITFSIGIALYPDDGDSFEKLSMSADTAMYRAKQAGRNAYRFFTAEMQLESSRQLELENGLRRALDLQQLSLVYQPQVSLMDGRVTGMEALLRWHHPTLGQVSPLEFIPVAEESGLILSIGEWVLRTATRQLRVWLDAGLPALQLSVNLSAVQFRHANLPDLVTQVLFDAGLEPHCLELELTESVAMNDPPGAVAIMDKLHQRGVRLSIDDFGTGYSSLSYLKRFKVYKLKVDQSFVQDISTDPDDKAIVVAVIALARSLGFQTIAEGVETQGQLDFLRQQGCDEVQGYFYSQPLPVDQFEAFVRQHLLNAVALV
ncbi:MAG: EAL domain-containing protein [Rhodoferax sp.]|uniref:bifunctional diguanylate cyclase/phosphodiesterase n=1 Tax=Rhodoferax sp. TaxID=50421 RepID=UPI0013FF4A13|nr:EAL domain-containing protein [Rhodoferax sp.]NDP39914.1 EAL domain-containing protein [Rhodoferax sp.]